MAEPRCTTLKAGTKGPTKKPTFRPLTYTRSTKGKNADATNDIMVENVNTQKPSDKEKEA